jgi:hypothetical protein
LPSEEYDDAFLERHPYLRPERLKHVMDVVSAQTTAFEADEVEFKQTVPASVTIKPQPELQLVPRYVIEDEEPGPPPLSIADARRFKTYLALAVMAGILLVGAPISVVTAYRYLNPVYMYEQVPQNPTPAAEQPAPAPKRRAKPSGGANSGAQPRSARSSRNGQALQKKQPAVVWPKPPE